MPRGYTVIDDRTVEGPDGRRHHVEDAIKALTWTDMNCPVMAHQYSIIGKDGPDWARDVIGAMLLVRTGRGFRAYFRGYPWANNYWDGPDGWRYWRRRYEIDRGRPEDADLRRVDQGARPVQNLHDSPWSPSGLGLYERDDKGRWWPTAEALEAGYQPCRACQLTSRKGPIVAEPEDRHRTPAVIAEAQREIGRDLTLNELKAVLRKARTLSEADQGPGASR